MILLSQQEKKILSNSLEAMPDSALMFRLILEWVIDGLEQWFLTRGGGTHSCPLGVFEGRVMRL